MPNPPKHRILIVDDDPKVRAMVAMMMAAQGYEIASAEDGLEALVQMRSSLPQLVISDLNMPQMSGFELLAVIRRTFPQVLVVAMSGDYEEGDGMPKGVVADAFYAKGCSNPDTLLHVVAGLLGN